MKHELSNRLTQARNKLRKRLNVNEHEDIFKEEAMRRRTIMAGIMLGLIINMFPPVSLAVDEVPTPAVEGSAQPPEAAPLPPAAEEFLPDEDLEYSFGVVQQVSPTQIVVREYDYLTDQETDVTYHVDSSVELENVDSVDGIKVGDDVEVDYVMKDGNKVAVTIAVETLVEEDEEFVLPEEKATVTR